MLTHLHNNLLRDSQLSIPQEVLQFTNYARSYFTKEDLTQMHNMILNKKNLLIEEIVTGERTESEINFYYKE